MIQVFQKAAPHLWVRPLHQVRFLFAMCFVLLFPIETFAHDLYIVPTTFHVKGGQALQVSFRNGDAFPESEVAPTPIRLANAQVTSAQGQQDIKNLRITGNETIGDVTVPAGGSLQISVTTVPNFIELAPDKFESYLKEEGLNEVVEWRAKHGESTKPGRERYTKFAKSLVQNGKGDGYFRHPLGLAIEIVPLVNPYGLHIGGRLPVRVLFRGKPVADLQLEAARVADGKSLITPIGRTNADGRVDVPIDHTGKWRLHSLRMQRSEDPKVSDWESFWASLTFEIS